MLHESVETGRWARGRLGESGALLCVANFPSNTGYAWNFIESLYAGVADRLAPRGIGTWVAYPSLSSPPATLEGSAVEAVELPFGFDRRSLGGLAAFVRDRDVRVLYLTDQPTWHPAYALIRRAGVRRIIIHDHTSGVRTPPRGPKRVLKKWTRRLPGLMADDVIAVSDYVVRRKVEVDLVPADRVHRIWNSLPVPVIDPLAPRRVRRLFGIGDDRVVIACACRAVPEKGVAHLLRAFDRLVAGLPAGAPAPALVYMGGGPGLEALAALRARLPAGEHVILTGYRPDAPDLLGGADFCIVPSVWQEAFGLAALEPMMRGVPVIATAVGGLPEVVIDGETGVLVPPADEVALERAMGRLLGDPAERRRLGENGRRRCSAHFSREAQLHRLVAVVEKGFGG